LGQLDEAERIFGALVKEAPETPYGLGGLASVAIHRRDWHEALSLLTRCREHHADHATTALATVLFNIGRPAEAARLWEEMMQRDARNPDFAFQHLMAIIETHKLAGDLFSMRGELREDIDKWLHSAPGGNLHIRGARLLLAIGCLKEAAAQLVAGLGYARTPDQIDACFRLVPILTERGSRGALWHELLRQLRTYEHAFGGTSKSNELELCILLALERFEEFCTRFGGVQAHLPGNAKRILLESVHERLSKPRHAVFAERKIFGIGLTKTGTTSLSAALTELGIDTAHYLNPLTHQLISDVDLYMFGACTDISAAQEFEKLYYQYPNARFIWTRRPLESWHRSFFERHPYSAGGLEALRSAYDGDTCLHGFSAAALRFGIYLNAASLEDAYRFYDERVAHFFSDKPVEKLLELNLFSGQGWPELCGFLGCPRPSQPFPWLNRANRDESKKETA
jgi:tetratricopeptide (TPR) repeat protein